MASLTLYSSPAELDAPPPVEERHGSSRLLPGRSSTHRLYNPSPVQAGWNVLSEEWVSPGAPNDSITDCYDTTDSLLRAGLSVPRGRGPRDVGRVSVDRASRAGYQGLGARARSVAVATNYTMRIRQHFSQLISRVSIS